MRKYLLPFVFSVMIIFSCNPATNFITQYLTSSNLTEQAFTIQTDRDTTIKTTEGIIISIPANSIKTDGNRVTLEVKEALTMADILKAGLTSQAGKDILSSDGMFYIGTKEQSTITRAIHIRLPTANANRNMQLYKGVEKDGKIDWQSPTPIAKTITPLADSGEVLFKKNCTSCHAIDKQLTGTALAWMDKRRSKDWLHTFIQNNQKILANGDGYANCVYCKYGSAMTIFPNLTNRDIDLICKYIDKVSKEKGIPENFNPNSDCDSCDYYQAYYNSLMTKRDSLKKSNGPMVKVNVIPPPLASTDSVIFNVIYNKITPPVNDAEYYQFTVTAYGWYNVDVLLNSVYNSQESELRVRVQGIFNSRVSVMLAIPSAKVFGQGGKLENSDDYGFHTTDGKIPLPQGTDAFIIAVSEQNEKLYCCIEHFTTALSQTININLKETDRETLLKSFESFHPDSIQMQIDKTKNFDGMKAVDAELQSLEHKLSHCACKADSSISVEAIPR